MSETRDLLERVGERFAFPDQAFERMLRRRDRKRRNQRLAAGAVGIAIAIAAISLGSVWLRSGPVPADRPVPPAPRMHNGPIDVFGFTKGVRELAPGGRLPFVVKCSGSCTEIDSAVWSPDGTRMAFSASCGGSCASAGDPYHGIRIYDPAAGTDRLILPGDLIGSLAWSPDGTKIAYAAGGGVAVIDADGSHRIELIPAVSPDQVGTFDGLSWSPDGTRLAYSVQGNSVWIVGVDGSDPRQIASGANPAWSPDGRVIAYAVGRCRLRAVSPDGKGDRVLINLARSRPDAASCEVPHSLAWSPDGTELALLVEGGPPGVELHYSRQGVFVVDADGSGAQLISGWDREHPYFGVTWQPIP